MYGCFKYEVPSHVYAVLKRIIFMLSFQSFCCCGRRSFRGSRVFLSYSIHTAPWQGLFNNGEMDSGLAVGPSCRERLQPLSPMLQRCWFGVKATRLPTASLEVYADIIPFKFIVATSVTRKF